MNIRARSFLPLTAMALAGALFAAGCSDDSTTPPADAGPTDGGPTDGGTLGSGNLTSSNAVANGSSFSLPFDAAPSPDGSQIYFTGVQSSTMSAGIFKVAASGGTVTPLAVGGSIGAPFGVAVSSDGNTVYAADPAYATTNDMGAIFSVSSGGGNPTVLAETADYAPFAVAVAKVGGSDSLYFLGTDKTNALNGIFKDTGGTVSVIGETGPIALAAAFTVYTDGTIYFATNAGALYKVAAGSTTATAIGGAAGNLAIFSPGGIAVSQDGNYLLVPVTDPATKGESIARVNASTGAVTQLGLSLSTNQEGGGIHRAANADVYSFVDTGAGSSGSVYLLK